MTGFFSLQGEQATAKARKLWAERYGWFGPVEVFGILRFAQDDSRNKQGQVRSVRDPSLRLRTTAGTNRGKFAQDDTDNAGELGWE